MLEFFVPLNHHFIERFDSFYIAQFPFKIFYKIVWKRDSLKIINLYHQTPQKENPNNETWPHAKKGVRHGLTFHTHNEFIVYFFFPQKSEQESTNCLNMLHTFFRWIIIRFLLYHFKAKLDTIDKNGCNNSLSSIFFFFV